jgi:hypothetical protein
MTAFGATAPVTRRKPLNGRPETRGYGCATCRHPKREEIEAALAARTPSLKVLSGRYGMDATSLSRHRSNHMAPSVAIHTTLPADASTLEQLEDQARRVEVFFAAAERAGHADQLVNWSRELRLLREAISKKRGEVNGPAVVTFFNIQHSEEWAAIREVIWRRLESHPPLRTAIAKDLMALAKRGGT